MTVNPLSPDRPPVVAIPGATTVLAASCPSVSLCVAGDEQAFAFVGLAAPVKVRPPGITGTAQVGKLLTEHNGALTGAPTSYRHQWFDCNRPASSARPSRMQRV